MTRVVCPGGWVATYMWDSQAGGAPIDPVYKAINALGMPSALPPNPTVSRQEALEKLWNQTGLEAIDTQVIRIPVVYSDFNDFWDSNSLPIGPQGKMINGMPPETRELLRTRLRGSLPVAPDGRIVYEAFANAVKGRVPG